MNQLTKIGNKYRLEGNGKTHSFEDAQAVIDHLNRFDLVRDTEGLENLPVYFFNQITYGRTPKAFVCNNCKRHFDMAKTLGKEESESEVCPHCYSEDFVLNPVLKSE